MTGPRSPLAIPQGRAGSLFLLHETLQPGERVFSRTIRSAMLAGGRSEWEVLAEPLVVHKLLRLTDAQVERAKLGRSLVGERASVLMSDHPCELRWMADLAAETYGRVFVGGFGLGLLVEILAARPEVERIDVVELDPDVLALTAAHLSQRAQLKTVVHVADVRSYLETATAWPWDFTLLDTWYGTGETTWEETVAPLRRTLRRRFGAGGPRVRSWCEPEMVGQVRHGMAAFGVGLAASCRHSRAQWAFRMGTGSVLPPVASGGPLARDVVGLERLGDPVFDDLARLYLGEVGSEAWELRFGTFWDGWTSGDLRSA